VTSLELLSKCLLNIKLCFDMKLYSNLGKKIVMRARSNVHVGRKFPTPALEPLINFLAFLVLKLWPKTFLRNAQGIP